MGEKRKKIFFVDDNKAILAVGKNILDNDYDIYAMTSAERMFGLLAYVHPDLILLDAEMPGTDGYAAIKRLKSSEGFADIPVVLLVSGRDIDNEARGLALGAADYMFKPFSAPLLIQRIERHLLFAEQQAELRGFADNFKNIVNRRTQDAFSLGSATLAVLCELLEFRGHEMGGHVRRIKSYIALLIDRLIAEDVYAEEASCWDLDFVLPAAQLHDIGKIAVRDDILEKPERLAPDEYEIVKTHAEFGVRMIRRIEEDAPAHQFLVHAKAFAGTHHERWDGTGYPYGLVGQEIPLEGRLLAIADAYDALITERPYKRAYSTDEAELAILEGMGSRFDPALAGVFAEASDSFALIAGAYHKTLRPKTLLRTA